MDNWMSVYEELDKKDFEYLTIDEWSQEPATAENPSDFGFTFVLMRSQRELRHKRVVYSILDYLADLGGLNEAFMFILEPILGLFLPAIFAREVLNSNFKYDEGKQTAPSLGFSGGVSTAEKNGLVRRIRNSMERLTLNHTDLATLKSSLVSLKQFNLSYFSAILAQNLSCCLKRRSVKHYIEGKEAFEKRINIVKLIKNSIDLEVLKKLYLLPRQRNLFKKQRRMTFKMDSSSSSAPEMDSDKDCKIFEPNNLRSILNADLKNTTDRRLLLGLLHRDNDLEPRKIGSGMQGTGQETPNDINNG